jgi:ubiquinone/menaquinone biosynthesis C-methylase UbiE
MVEKTFHELEHEAWSERACEYDEVFAPVSTQAISYILDSLGFLGGKCHLDIACGTGHLVAAAWTRGAISVGIDFAQPMIEIARATYPKAGFEVADATDLPYEDESFDAVTCAFGLLHMENPQAAVNEAFRVLKPGGQFAFTLWFGAEDGNEMKQIVQTALEEHAVGLSAMPAQRTQLRDADRHACLTMTREAGFSVPAFKRLPIVSQTGSADDHFGIIERVSVRTRLIIDRQAPALRQRIREQIRAEIETRRSNGLISLAWPAMLVVAQKPSGKEVT